MAPRTDNGARAADLPPSIGRTLGGSIGRRAARLSGILNTVAWNAAIFFFAAMLLIVLFKIGARYIFRAPPPWTAEAARYCMVWGGMLGATVAFYRRQDPKLFTPPRRGRVWVRFGALAARTLAVLIFLLPVLRYSPRFLARSAQRTTEVLGIPAVWITAAVPLSVAIILFHQLARLLSLEDLSPPGETPSTQVKGSAIRGQ
jgi:TRAP-type transport system small permease protein